MRAVSRGALASVCWHCSMQSGGTAVHEGKQCLFPCDVTMKSTSSFIQINSCNLPYTFCEQIGKEIRNISDEIPFEIPDSWEWCRIGSVFTLQAGKNISANQIAENVEEGLYPCFGGNGVRGYVPLFNREGYYPIIGRQGALCGNINLANGQFYATEHAVCVETFANTNVLWCCYFLTALNLNQYATATAQPGLAVANINEVLIPLPPLSEQHRIVAKIEELLPYIERYGKAEEHLTALNTTFPEALKKSILQEAVQGKLVPQNPDDEPASVLLERIRAEKQKLIKAGKIKKSKHESVIITRDKIPYEIVDGKERCIADDVPFEIPDTWCWCRLGTISCYFDAGKSPNCIKQSVTGDEYGVITTTSIQLGYFNESQNKVLPPNFEVKEDMKVKKGDILITRAGPMNRTGVACVVKEIHYNLILSDKTIRINMPDEFFDKDYIVTVLNSPNIREQIIRLMSGMDKQQVNISQDKYKTVFIPLPPLEEQHRIVAKIEELMQYCDRLK